MDTTVSYPAKHITFSQVYESDDYKITVKVNHQSQLDDNYKFIIITLSKSLNTSRTIEYTDSDLSRLFKIKINASITT